MRSYHNTIIIEKSYTFFHQRANRHGLSCARDSLCTSDARHVDTDESSRIDCELLWLVVVHPSRLRNEKMFVQHNRRVISSCCKCAALLLRYARCLWRVIIIIIIIVLIIILYRNNPRTSARGIHRGVKPKTRNTRFSKRERNKRVTRKRNYIFRK